MYEDSIVVAGTLPIGERSRLLDPLVLTSAEEAASRGQSLALIRPRDTTFIARPKTASEIDDERDAYRRAAAQTSMLDQQLADLEPSPYEFRFRFEDGAGKHDYENGDWETHAMFWSWRHQYGEEETLRRMNHVFNDEYPNRGMVFAVGNQAKRPKTWQLLGVIRLDEVRQGDLFG